MLGRIISAVAGRAAARQVGGVNAGPIGAMAGAALPFVLRRFGPVGMIGAAIGGYAVKQLIEKRARRATATPGGIAGPPARDSIRRKREKT